MVTKAQHYIEMHHDFEQLAVVDSSKANFEASPMIGVTRMLFERVGAESTRRATSVVRYQADSYFDWHSHPGGEEILVLAGTFSDQNGDYPAGYYVRNPVGSRHKPFSVEGCEILVKLSQMPENETEQFVLNTATASSDNIWQQLGHQESILSLWHSTHEHTSLHHLTAGYQSPDTPLCYAEVCEIFVVSGSLTVNTQYLPCRSWIRLPAKTAIQLTTQEDTLIYRKIGKGAVRI